MHVYYQGCLIWKTDPQCGYWQLIMSDSLTWAQLIHIIMNNYFKTNAARAHTWCGMFFYYTPYSIDELHRFESLFVGQRSVICIKTRGGM